MKKLQKTTEIIIELTNDKENKKPTIKEAKVGQKKVLEVTYWHGISEKMKEILIEKIPSSYGHEYSRGSIIGYPCIFNNNKGGGIVESFTVIWL